MKTNPVLILLLSIFLLTNALAIELYTIEIPQINTPNKISTYNKFIKLIESKIGSNFKITYLPQNRALKKFEQEKDVCFFPFSKIDGREIKNYQLSKPVVEMEFYAINLKVNKALNKNGEYKTIGMKSFYKDNFVFPKDIKVYYVETDQQLMFMLDNNRVDYIIESVPDIYLSFSSIEEFNKKYHFDKTFKYATIRDYFACHKNNKSGIKLINLVNSSL